MEYGILEVCRTDALRSFRNKEKEVIDRLVEVEKSLVRETANEQSMVQDLNSLKWADTFQYEAEEEEILLLIQCASVLKKHNIKYELCLSGEREENSPFQVKPSDGSIIETRYFFNGKEEVIRKVFLSRKSIQ